MHIITILIQIYKLTTSTGAQRGHVDHREAVVSLELHRVYHQSHHTRVVQVNLLAKFPLVAVSVIKQDVCHSCTGQAGC